MIKALFRSIGALGDVYFWKIMVLCLLVSGVLFASVLAGMAYFAEDYLYGWLFNFILGWLGPFIAFFMAWLFFPIMLPLVTLLFLDPVASYMERKYYRDAADVREAAFTKTLWPTLKFVTLAVLLNLILLPLYFIPIVGQIIYYWVNGYLYGREYFEMIALRYHASRDIKAIRKAHKTKILMAGILIAISFTIPLLNLIAPIFATIFIVHIYHGVTAE